MLQELEDKIDWFNIMVYRKAAKKQVRTVGSMENAYNMHGKCMKIYVIWKSACKMHGKYM